MLITEDAFAGQLNDVIRNIEAEGLGLHVTIQANDENIVRYGQMQANEIKCELINIEPLKCTVRGGATRGTTAQDSSLAMQVWADTFCLLQQIIVEHWRAREPNRAVWSGIDPSTQKKRIKAVADATLTGLPVAYVRLDCDGFGEVKKLIGGEREPTEVIHNIAAFLRAKFYKSALVFHPHGDEFELVFVDWSPCKVISMLREFQDCFKLQDFRPVKSNIAIKLGIRMGVVFWPNGYLDIEASGIYDFLRKEAEGIDLKGLLNRGFIEVASPSPLQDGVLEKGAVEQAMLSAHRGLAVPEVSIFANPLHNQIAQWLISEGDTLDTLTAKLERLFKQFVITIFSHSHGGPLALITSRFIHTADLAGLLLHVALKRAFLCCQPALLNSRLRIVISRPSIGSPWVLKVERSDGSVWVEVATVADVMASEELQIDAGFFWVSQTPNDRPPQQTALTRWTPSVPNNNNLSPCLLGLVGAEADKLGSDLGPWCAATVRIDDRPVTSGDLPDFWQRNAARIIVECLRNPNIRTVILVRKEPKTVSRTTAVLKGTLSFGQELTTLTISHWANATIDTISRATTLSTLLVHDYKDREIQLIEVSTELKAAISAIIKVFLDSPERLASRGKAYESTLKSGCAEDQLLDREFKVEKLSTAFPKIMRVLRHVSTPRYAEPTGEQIAELTCVRVELESPHQQDVPAYWASVPTEFDNYYNRAFASDSLFGRRFYTWGSGLPTPIDQVDHAISSTLEEIRQKRVGRRIMLVAAEPPGTAATDPLGLVSVHILPRRRNDSHEWRLDFIWVWRSVEALVGFPFSAYGSVRFSTEFLNKVKVRLDAQNISLRLGSVTYLAISLHLYCDPADLAIARQIDLDART